MTRVVFVVETKRAYGARSYRSWPSLTWAVMSATALEAEGFECTVTRREVSL